MAKFKFAEWLLVWLLDSEDFEFEWDEANRAKSAKKHGVSASEIEEAFTSGPEERMGIVGKTIAGRAIVVVFTVRERKIRPISAREANKQQREYYETLAD